jgi:hypothetical protein
VPAWVGASAKPNVVLRDESVPPTDRIPFANPAVTEPAAVLVPSTLKVIGEEVVGGAGFDGGGAGFEGAGAGLEAAGGELRSGEVGLPFPPHASVRNMTATPTSIRFRVCGFIDAPRSRGKCPALVTCGRIRALRAVLADSVRSSAAQCPDGTLKKV